MVHDEKHCVVLGLNPAWQRTVCVARFEYGHVNRAETATAMAGGKGANVARALRALGNTPVLVQFTGGVTGQRIIRALQEEGIRNRSEPIAKESRVCTTILSKADGAMTEVIEPSPGVSAGEVEALAARLPAAPEVAAVALCGTVPKGVPDSFFADVIRRFRATAWVVLDACRDIHEALVAGPHILKINRAELLSLAACDDIVVAARRVLERYPIAGIGVTDGPDRAAFITAEQICTYRIPPLDDVVSPLGAGDVATATLVSELLAWSRPVALEPNAVTSCHPEFATFARRAFRRALAVASASCLTEQPAIFDIDAVAEIESQITVECHDLDRES